MHSRNEFALPASIGLLAVFVVTSALADDLKIRRKGVEAEQRPAAAPVRLPSKETLQCSAHDPLVGTGNRAGSVTVRRDSSCYVDWSHAAEMIRTTSSAVIDVRSPESYAQLHLPDAMQLGMGLIKTKPFLLSKPLVIYSTGKRDLRLEELCSDLKDRGFANVKILSGGILAWARSEDAETAVRTTVGVDLLKLAELSAEDLYAELQSDDSTIIKVSPAFTSPEVDRRAVNLEGPLSPESVAFALAKAKAKAKNVLSRRVVLLGVDKAPSRILTEILASPKIGLPVFYYPEDERRFEIALQNMHARWGKMKKGPAASGCGFS